MPSSYSIGDHYEKLARELVASGRYASVSEVLRDGLRLLEEREALRAWKIAELKKAIQEGLDSGDAGSWDAEEFLSEMHNRRSLDDAA